MSVLNYAVVVFVALSFVGCGGFRKSDSVYVKDDTITSSRAKTGNRGNTNSKKKKVKRANPNDYKIQPQ